MLFALTAVATVIVLRPDPVAGGADDLEARTVRKDGDSIALELTYRSAGFRISDERVRVRAEVTPAAGPFESARLTRRFVTAEIELAEPGVYRGQMLLPSNAVFARFVIEEAAGSVVRRAPGSAWTYLFANDVRAVTQKLKSFQESDTRAAFEAAEELVRLEPGSPVSWAFHSALRRRLAGPDSMAAVEDEYRSVFARLAEAHRTRVPTADEVAGLFRLARLVGDEADTRYWRARLLADHPAHPVAVDQAIADVMVGAGGDLEARLEGLESLDSRHPGHDQLASLGFATALAVGDSERALSWGQRHIARQPNDAAFVLDGLSRFPELANSVGEIAREALSDGRGTSRPLGVSVLEHSRRFRETQAQLLVGLGAALASSGQYASARDTLARAVGGHWSPAVFETAELAYARMGDSVSAARMAALLAVDELAPALHPSPPYSVGDDAWRGLLQAARAEMTRVFQHQGERGADGLLLTVEHDTVSLRQAVDDVTLLAYWRSADPIGSAGIRRLAAIAQNARELPRRIVAVVEARSPDELRELKRVADAVDLGSVELFVTATPLLAETLSRWAGANFYAIGRDRRILYGGSAENAIRATLIAQSSGSDSP